MLSEAELEILTNDMIDNQQKEMIELARGVFYGREAGKTEIMGSMGECSGADRVSGKDVRKD